MRKILFKGIKFLELKENQFYKIISKNGLFVFPSGPGLASISDNKNYYNSLKNADFVFLDSGFFVILLKIFKNKSLIKFSGYKFLKYFFKYLKHNRDQSIFCIDPNVDFSKKNKKYIRNLGINKVDNYIAPNYNVTDLNDYKLLIKIKSIKPKFILINISGGKQEILGIFLKNNLKHNCSIICTGGAISFFTGDQAPINNLIDKLYLGWLVRLIFNPSIFFKRYVYALKLIKIVIQNKVK